MTQYTEDTTAADLEFEDQMQPSKNNKRLDKKARKRDKKWREDRKQARGRKWQ